MDFTKAIEHKPDHAWAYYERGRLEKVKGDLDAAMVD